MLVEIAVVEAFVLPIVVTAAVVGVKILEVALNREIASSQIIARNVAVFTVGATILGVIAWFVFVIIAMSGDPS
jgi:hypothetical protein